MLTSLLLASPAHHNATQHPGHPSSHSLVCLCLLLACRYLLHRGRLLRQLRLQAGSLLGCPPLLCLCLPHLRRELDLHLSPDLQQAAARCTQLGACAQRHGGLGL